MARQADDIVMRLKLRAEEYKAEQGRVFDDLKAHAAAKAAEIAGSIKRPFAVVAAEASALARNFNFDEEIASATKLGAAATEQAGRLRMLATAKRAAADAGQGDVNALRLEAAAAIDAATAEERLARSMEAKAASARATKEQMSILSGASEIYNGSAITTGKVTNANRGAMAGLSYQIQDTITQLGMGANLFQTLAVQGGQAAGAFVYAEGAAGSFARFMLGPYGLAITAGAMVLGPMVSKLWEDADASKAAEKASADLGAQVKDLSNYFDTLTGKLKETNRQKLIFAALDSASARDAAYKGQQDTKAKADAIVANSTRFQMTGGGGYTPGGGYTGQAQRGSDSLAAIFRGRSGNDPRIDTDLLNLRNSNDPNAGAAGDLIKLRAEFEQFKSERYRADKLYKSYLDGKLDKSLMTTKPDRAGRSSGGGSAKPREDAATPRDAEAVEKINIAWSEQPTLVKRAADANLELDKIVADLEKRRPPNFKDMIAEVATVRAKIADGMTRPFRDFVQAQEESLAVSRLQLQGRDAEAAALQDILRIKRDSGKVDSAQMAAAQAYARQQEKIRDLFEDQQRIVGIATGTVRQMQQSFDQFLGDMETRPTKALSAYAGSFVSSFKQLQRDLYSNAIFGGVDRDIAKYVRSITGRETPAEIIEKQADGAGKALKSFAETVEGISFRLGGGLSALNLASKENGGVAGSAIQALINSNASPGGDEQDIVVRALKDQATSTVKLVDGLDIYRRITDKLAANLADLGVSIPKAIRDSLPNAIQGASVFSSIGSQFGGAGGNVGGGIGAALGTAFPHFVSDFAAGFPVYQLGQSIAQPLGKMLGFDQGNVAVGGLVGGLIGKILGIGPSIKFGDAGLSLANGVISGSAGFGRGGSAIGAASGSASGIAGQLNSILDQIGATVSTLAPITVGMWNGNYRVARANTTEALNGNSSVAKAGLVENFGTDQAAAIAYAVQYELSHAIISGISAASQRLLAGGDAQAQLAKVMLVEAIPKDLKAMLDPVGAAIDELNRGWTRTVAALDEGGASAEQYAQAQDLYRRQLDQVKASTASASQTLKDFQNSLMIGGNSPYSFRDQEASARAALQPYLDTINGGGNVDQSKYQQAAKDFLDIERQLYGSTQAYFDALDSVQAATNKAIATIDNAVPITPGVPDPFTKATSEAAAKTAQGVQTGNEIADTHTELLTSIASSLAQLAANGGTLDSGFIGAPRLFA